MTAAYGVFLEEEKLNRHDLGLLHQFVQNDSVTYNGNNLRCVLEDAYMDNGSMVQRPVIRTGDGAVVLTRIDPNRKETSMLLRPRPGWHALRAILTEEHETYVPFRPFPFLSVPSLSVPSFCIFSDVTHDSRMTAGSRCTCAPQQSGSMR